MNFSNWFNEASKNDLEQAVINNPFDLTTRLIFADWLEERGKTIESTILRNNWLSTLWIKEVIYDPERTKWIILAGNHYNWDNAIKYLRNSKWRIETGYIHGYGNVSGRGRILFTEENAFRGINISVHYWVGDQSQGGQLAKFPELERILLRSGGVTGRLSQPRE